MSDARGLMFSTISTSGTPTTKFDLSHEHKTTLNAGSITPVLCQECLPGEIHDLDVRSFVRLMPMTFPIFQRMDLFVHAFFVPNRILWSGWNDFIWNGAGKIKMTQQANFVPPVKPFFTPADLRACFKILLAEFNDPNSTYGQEFYNHYGDANWLTADLLVAYILTGDKRFLNNKYFGQNFNSSTGHSKNYLIQFISTLLGIKISSLSSLPNYLGYQYAVNLYVMGRMAGEVGFANVNTDATTAATGSTQEVTIYNNITSKFPFTRFADAQDADYYRYLQNDYAAFITDQLPYNGTALSDDGVDYMFAVYAYAIATDTQRIELMPFHAYVSIFNEYYRDENVDQFIDFPSSSGQYPVPTTLTQAQSYPLLHILFCKDRAWQHDYFTSCFPQQSRNNVLIPVNLQMQSLNTNGQPADITAAVTTDETDLKFKNQSNGNIGVYQSTNVDYKVGEFSVKSTSLMDDLRTAMHLQRFWDKITRSGSRIREAIRSLFPNTRPDNLSPDEPVYLGGSSVPVTISEVTQTSESSANSALGDMAGHGVASGSSSHIHLETHEHGFFVVLVSIRPRTGYSQGISRMFNRWTYLDYAWSDLSRLGEQPVFTPEIFNQPDAWSHLTSAQRAIRTQVQGTTFGYIPRYSEYKYLNDRVSGDFRQTSYDDWHLNRIFERVPILNPEFIHVDSRDCDRIFAYEDSDYDHFVGVFYLDYQAVRPLPMYADPTF